MKDIKKKLDIPLPDKALKQHPTRKYLTTINPIFVIERLNDTFGLGGWRVKYKVLKCVERWVIVKAYLRVKGHNIEIEQYGGNDNEDLGDAYKGAATDALVKCASYLGIGMNIWKNENKKKIQTYSNEAKATDRQLTLLVKLYKENGRDITIADLKSKGVTAAQASEQISKLIGSGKK